MKIDYCINLRLDGISEVECDQYTVYNDLTRLLARNQRGEVLVIVGDVTSRSNAYTPLYDVLDKWCADHYNKSFIVINDDRRCNDWRPDNMVVLNRYSSYSYHNVKFVGKARCSDITIGAPFKVTTVVVSCSGDIEQCDNVETVDLWITGDHSVKEFSLKQVEI